MQPAFGESRNEPDAAALAPEMVCIPAAWFDAFILSAGSQDEAIVLAACMRMCRDEQGVLVVEEHDLLSNDALIAGVGSTGSQTATSKILRALNRAVRRGALVRMWVGEGDAQRTRYALPVVSAEQKRQATAVADDPDDGARVRSYDPTAPSVFTAYEDAIGMLTPLVADQIQQALERHPAEQLLDAIREAVRVNRRSWRYIQHILQNWSGPGRESVADIEVNHETHQRRDQERLDPDQYRGERHLERARDLQVRDL
ncbi:MAG: DnaD domain protein [Thermomicrobiales bacterium]|nr:DnaD domain protein [Thermomicrobiales bacterium]